MDKFKEYATQRWAQQNKGKKYENILFCKQYLIIYYASVNNKWRDFKIKTDSMF